MIDNYLADLRGQLRIPSDRILAEVEDHLREAAEHGDEPSAVARFGPPKLVAARFHADVADRDTRRTVRAVVIAGVVLFGLFLVVDFIQPRAPWPDRVMPLGLEWKLHVAMLAGQVALAAGLIALVHRNQLARLRSGVTALCAAAVALAFHVAFELDRLTRVHHSARFTALVVTTVVVRVAAVAVALVLAWRGERRVARFHAPGSGLLTHGWVWCIGLAVLAGIAVFAHDEATRTRSIVDGGLEAATVVAAFALLSRPLGLVPASRAAYTARRTRQ